jgi:hypothetical protein
MNYRINTKVVAVVGAFAIVAIGLFLYTVVSAPTPEEVAAPTEEQAPDTEGMLITARHQFKEGVHTIVGTVAVPTACHRIQVNPFLLDGGAVVEVRLTSLMEGSECPPQPTDAPFRATFEAGESVEIRAPWNGTPVRLNLVDVGADELLDGDVYIKG